MLSPISAGPRPASPHGKPAGTHSAPQSGGFAATRAPRPPSGTPATAAARRARRRGTRGGPAAPGLGEGGRRGAARRPRAEGAAVAVPAAAGPSGPPQGGGAAGPGPEPPKPNLGRRKGELATPPLCLGVPVSREGGAASAAAAASHPQGQSAAGAAAGPPRGERQPARPRRLGGTAAKPARAPHRPPPGRHSLGLLLPSALCRAAERGSRRLLPAVPPRRGRAVGRRISEERQQQQEGEGQPQEQAVRHQLLPPAHPQQPPGRAHPPAAPGPCAPTLGQPRRQRGKEEGGGRGPDARPEGREAAVGCHPAWRLGGWGKAVAAALHPARGGSSPGRRGGGLGGGLLPSSRPRGCHVGLGTCGGPHYSAYSQPAPGSQNVLKKRKTKQKQNPKSPTALEGAGGGSSSPPACVLPATRGGGGPPP